MNPIFPAHELRVSFSYVATSAINPSNWTRSYARSGYIDPLPPRPNLSILVNATVTQVLLTLNSTTGNQRATGVTFQSSASDPATTVKARREVIVSGGAVASAQILMLSGIGPKDVLTNAGVKQIIDLPGVGQHVRDHLSTAVAWNTKIDTAKTIHDALVADNQELNATFLSFINSATAYVGAPKLFADIDQFAAGLEDQRKTAVQDGLVPSSDPTVQAGYDAIYQAEESLVKTDVGAVEILLGLMGSAGGARTLQVQCGIQHPRSAGLIWITSASAFDKPSIDPGYMSHPADIAVLREGLKLARKIGTSAGLGAIAGDEVIPGSSVQTDADWEDFIRKNVYTEYHPSGGCALLPKELGGVVDKTFTVYGTDNLRVVDSSTFTIAYAAHVSSLRSLLL
jgi:choline dehydrogenase